MALTVVKGKADSANIVTGTNSQSNTRKEAAMAKLNKETQAVKEINLVGIEIARTEFETTRGKVIFNLNDEGEVKSVRFETGAEGKREKVKTFQSEASDGINLLRTWLNIILAGDFEKGLMEDGLTLINNDAPVGTFKIIGWRYDPIKDVVEGVKSFYGGHFIYENLLNSEGKYKEARFAQAYRRVKAALVYFWHEHDYTVSVGKRFRPWANEVLRTLQAPPEQWAQIRSLKTDLVVKERAAYHSTYKHVLEEAKTLKENGTQKEIKTFEVAKARQVSELMLKHHTGKMIPFSEATVNNGTIAFRLPSGISYRFLEVDDPALIERATIWMEVGYVLA